MSRHLHSAYYWLCNWQLSGQTSRNFSFYLATRVEYKTKANANYTPTSSNLDVALLLTVLACNLVYSMTVAVRSWLALRALNSTTRPTSCWYVTTTSQTKQSQQTTRFSNCPTTKAETLKNLLRLEAVKKNKWLIAGKPQSPLIEWLKNQSNNSP